MHRSKPVKQDHRQYYILIQNIKEPGNTAEIIYKGTIWILESKLSLEVVLVCKYEGDGTGMLKQIDLIYLKEINYETTKLLLGIPLPLSDRIKVVSDESWIKEGLEIKNETAVEVNHFPGLPNSALGIVRFKGRLPGSNGISFGIELHSEYAGKGTTNGTFRHKKLFTCGEDCGVFVSILRIRIARQSNDLKQRTGAEGRNNDKNVNNEYFRESPPLVSDGQLTLDERVVWMSDLGAEVGSVKWIGTLPYSIDNKIVVGVNFDNPIGTGTGRYKGIQLFRAKRGHASLIPILGLLRASVYMSMLSGNDNNDSPSVVDEYQDFRISNELITKRISGEGEQATGIKDSLDRLVDQYQNLEVKYAPRGLQGTTYNEQVIAVKSTVNDISIYDSGEKIKSHCNISGVKPKTVAIQSDGLESFAEKTIVDLGSISKKVQGFCIGDRVIVSLGSIRAGTIKWIGKFKKGTNPNRIIAGIEMDTEDVNCYTHGTFQGAELFYCSQRKALFFPLNKCLKE